MASTDTLADNTAFAKKNGATFPILADPDQAVSAAFGVLSDRGYARRWTYYIDPQGTVVHIDREVNPMTAGAELVKQLQRLQVPPAQSTPSTN